MISIPPSILHIHPEVRQARENHKPVLALETTILSHGMPYPENVSFALRSEAVVREAGVVPAAIGIISGKIVVGLDHDQLTQLCRADEVEKVAVRDISHVLFRKKHGATTVSATMAIAAAAGISVFATGGIGGVHRNLSQTIDISQDIAALIQYPLVVISAGAKAILDLPNTLEALEAAGVPVIGFGTTAFPSFYSRSSSLPVPFTVKTPTAIASWYAKHLNLGSTSALLVANPVPAENEIPQSEIDPLIAEALQDAEKREIRGKELTPYLLAKIVEKTAGRALKTNIALALNNIRLGCEVATEICLRPVSPGLRRTERSEEAFPS